MTNTDKETPVRFEHDLVFKTASLWATIAALFLMGVALGSFSSPVDGAGYRVWRRAVFGDLHTFLGLIFLVALLVVMFAGVNLWVTTGKLAGRELFLLANTFNFMYLSGITLGKLVFNVEPPEFRAWTADIFVAAMMLTGLISTVMVVKHAWRNTRRSRSAKAPA